MILSSNYFRIRAFSAAKKMYTKISSLSNKDQLTHLKRHFLLNYMSSSIYHHQLLFLYFIQCLCQFVCNTLFYLPATDISNDLYLNDYNFSFSLMYDFKILNASNTQSNILILWIKKFQNRKYQYLSYYLNQIVQFCCYSCPLML